jgi:hypothetical protein
VREHTHSRATRAPTERGGPGEGGGGGAAGVGRTADWLLGSHRQPGTCWRQHAAPPVAELHEGSRRLHRRPAYMLPSATPARRAAGCWLLAAGCCCALLLRPAAAVLPEIYVLRRHWQDKTRPSSVRTNQIYSTPLPPKIHAKRHFGGVWTLSLKSALRLCAPHVRSPDSSRRETAGNARVCGQRPSRSQATRMRAK